MAVVRMSGGQVFQVTETYEVIKTIIDAGWSGSTPVTDGSTGQTFTIKVPQIVSVQP